MAIMPTIVILALRETILVGNDFMVSFLFSVRKGNEIIWDTS